jgi:hypothetical protein
MKPILYKFVFSLLIFFSFVQNISAQQSKNILQGKVYTKSASASNNSTLKFTSATSGQSENVTNVLGKNYQVSISFNYKIVGKKVTIEYESSSDKEDYTIDLAAGKLISTHLEGYIDGKWGKVYWVEQK